MKNPDETAIAVCAVLIGFGILTMQVLQHPVIAAQPALSFGLGEKQQHKWRVDRVSHRFMRAIAIMGQIFL